MKKHNNHHYQGTNTSSTNNLSSAPINAPNVNMLTKNIQTSSRTGNLNRLAHYHSNLNLQESHNYQQNIIYNQQFINNNNHNYHSYNRNEKRNSISFLNSYNNSNSNQFSKQKSIPNDHLPRMNSANNFALQEHQLQHYQQQSKNSNSLEKDTIIEEFKSPK